MTLLLIILIALSDLSATVDRYLDKERCMFVITTPYDGVREVPMWGRVKIVESFEDVRVRVVTSDIEDLRVRIVDSAYGCGEWHFVEQGEDFTVRFVDHDEDFTIRLSSY